MHNKRNNYAVVCKYKKKQLTIAKEEEQKDIIKFFTYREYLLHKKYCSIKISVSDDDDAHVGCSLLLTRQ